MNQVAQRNIPEEWTPEMWQAKVIAMEEQLEDYKKAENAREKEFRELERDVYRLKNGNGPDFMSRLHPPNPQSHIANDGAGVAWLR